MKKLFLLLIAGLTLFSATCVYAESTVSHERHYQKIERKEKIKKPTSVMSEEQPVPQVTEESELPKTDNHTEQEPNSEDLAEEKTTIKDNSLHNDSNTSAKDDDSKQIEYIKEATDNSPAIETKATQEANHTYTSPANTENDNNLSQKSIIKDNDYFHDFKVYYPKIRFKHDDANSYIDISAFYGISKLGQEVEYVNISAGRTRYAYMLGSDTYSGLSVSYNLKFNPHVSKKSRQELRSSPKLAPK